MAPIKKKIVESLENLSLKAVLSSVIADLYLIYLSSKDLKDSFLLSSLRVKSQEELLKETSQRLQILPGLLNDQVRAKLIKEFFSKSELEKWPGSRIDVLKVLLNESVTSLSLGTRRFPQQALSIIGERCPNLTSLQIFLIEPTYSNDLDFGDTKNYVKQSFSLSRESVSGVGDELMGPVRKKRKLMENNSFTATTNPSQDSSLMEVMASFKYLTEAFILNGATNDLLTALGRNSFHLQKLHICYSFSVTDVGVKGLCLKNPSNHSQRRGCQLHDLRVLSFHLNPCCKKLTEFDTLGTCVTQFGVAFLLKHLPQLTSLGDCSAISEALEVLVRKNNIVPKNFALLPSIKRHAARYKLSRMKEERVTSNKFLLLSSLCPELKELTLGHSFQEVDLGRAVENYYNKKGLRSQMERLRHLKRLSLLNVGSISVRESVRAIGHQLTHLHVLCKGLDFQSVLESCINLTSLILEGSYVSAPYEALEAVRPNALRKLEVVRVRSYLPSSYIDLILSNSKKLSKIIFLDLGEIGDAKIEKLVSEGHFQNLTSLLVSKAPKLTVKAASLLIHKCPKLVDLQDLGGWNITSNQFYKLQNEIQKENFEINLSFGSLPRDNDSDVSSVSSDYTSDLFDAFRNIFPIVII